MTHSPRPPWSASWWVTLPRSFISIPTVRLPTSGFIFTPRTRSVHILTSSRSLFLHDKVHDLLYPLPGVLLGRMVPLLYIECFHFLTLKPRSARLSILFIVIRITPSYTGGRRTLRFLACGFGVTWGILVAQLIWICEKKTTWKVKHLQYSTHVPSQQHHRRRQYLSVQLGFKLP